MTSKFRTSENVDPSHFEFYEQSTSEYEDSSESNGSDTEASSAYEMSETSEDRAFVIPDSEATSYVASIASASGSNPFISEDSRDSDLDEVKPDKVFQCFWTRRWWNRNRLLWRRNTLLEPWLSGLSIGMGNMLNNALFSGIHGRTRRLGEFRKAIRLRSQETELLWDIWLVLHLLYSTKSPLKDGWPLWKLPSSLLYHHCLLGLIF